jgi:hypothetical protein
MKLDAWGIVAMLAVACSGDKDAGTGDTGSPADTDTTPASDAAIAAQLWEDIGGYESWATPPGWSTTPVLSGAHMGGYVVTYWDDALVAWDLTGSAPEGAIAVKNAYTDETGSTIADITVMQKRAGYDPANGDWFYAQYMADGTPMASGAVAMCVGCHASAPTDYVYSDPPAAM